MTITFDNRRESAAVLRQFGATKSADHLDDLENLVTLPGMTAAVISRLRGIGVSTLTELKDEDPKIIAYVAEVSAVRVAQWLGIESETPTP